MTDLKQKRARLRSRKLSHTFTPSAAHQSALFEVDDQAVLFVCCFEVPNDSKTQNINNSIRRQFVQTILLDSLAVVEVESFRWGTLVE